MNNGCLAIKVIATATTLQKRLLLCHSVVAHVFLHSHQRVTTGGDVLKEVSNNFVHANAMHPSLRNVVRNSHERPGASSRNQVASC